VKRALFVSKVFWAGSVLSILMLCSGVWLLFIPTYAGDGLFIMFFGAMTLALVLMTNIVVTRFQKWTINNARTLETTLALLARKSSETSKPQTGEEESFEEFEAFEPPLVEEKEEILEEQIPA
jgi:hypothetical protein